jgi:PAS domain S-box-containing protein
MRKICEAQIRRYTDLSQRPWGLDQPTQPALRSTDGEILDLLKETFMIRDMEGRIQYWNRGAGETYGWKREEAVGNISHHLLQTKFPRSLKEIESELARAGRWEGELVHTTKNGSTVRVKSRWLLQEQGNGASSVFEVNQICR